MMFRKRNRDDTQIFTFFDGQDMHEAFFEYSVANLKTTCQRSIPTTGFNSRTDLYKLIEGASTLIQTQIRERIVECMRKGKRRKTRRTTLLGNDQYHIPSASQEVDLQEIPSSINRYLDHTVDDLSENSFMKAPSKQVIESSIGEFIDRTCNSALAAGICAACARETNTSDLTHYRLDLVPNPLRLQPEVLHPAHDIFRGMLLHPAGVTDTESANICKECVRALNSDKIPSFSLANGLWIGDTPHELAFLTLPERLLIAKYFPAAYIIKLYPKKKGARQWDKRQMYNGLRGNVSTFQLDQGQIASMIDGTILPQDAKVLAATIGITFVGPKNLPDKCLPDIFKVRRTRVQRALEWLKENNSLFSNITISASRLAELPEDDIPYELRVTTKHSTDVNKLYAEQEGYVPSQDVCDDMADESM